MFDPTKDAPTGAKITTSEQATAWVEELTHGVVQARAACDAQPSADLARKAWATWMVRHGAALGTLLALHRVGLLSDVAYNVLREKVMATMMPTVVEARR